MDNIKGDAYYVNKIVNDLKFIISHTETLTLESLTADEVLSDCLMFRLVQISENSGKLTESFKLRYNIIPWAAIKGLRNRLVHNYGEVDLTIVYNTVKNDIPELLNLLQGLK